MSENESLEERLLRLEEAVASAEVRSSAAKMGALLSDAFVEFGASGTVYDKASILKELDTGSSAAKYRLEDFRVTPLGPMSALVTYRIPKGAPPEGAANASLRSSVWVEEDGQWRIVFHQGTRQQGK